MTPMIPMTEEEKLVMAHRYLYYVLGQPTISDYRYDKLEHIVRKNAPSSSPVHEVGSSLESSYTEDVIKIARGILDV